MTIISNLPDAPNRQVDDPATFSAKADNFAAAQATFVAQTNLVVGEVNTANSEANAASAAASAVANVTKWVSGTTYQNGQAVYSPTNYLTYRRITAAGSGTTDPANDATNYKQVVGTGNVTTDTVQTLSGAKTFSAPTVVTANSSSPALRVTQTGAGHALLIEDEGNPDATPFVVDSVGNVGAGTSSPTSKLHVVGSGNPTITLAGSDGAYTSIFSMVAAGGGSSKITANGGTNTLVLQTNGTDRAFLDSAGILGLGVTPSAWSVGKALQVGSTTAVFNDGSGATYIGNNFNFNSGFKYLTNNVATSYVQGNGHIWLTAPSGTAGNPISFTQAMTLTQGGDLLVGTTTDFGGKIQGFVTPSATPLPVFRVTNGANSEVLISLENNIARIENNGGNTVLAFGINSTERARITSAGYSKFSNTGGYIGAQSPYHEFNNDNATNETCKFLARASAYTSTVVLAETTATNAVTGFNFYSAIANGALVYRVLGNGNVQNTNNSYGAISDIKLKENITDATPKLANLNQLRVVNYNLKADESKLKQIGLIAQEVEQVFPGLVEETPDTVEVTKTRTVEVPAVLDEEGNEVTPATTTEETYTEREPNGEVTKAVKYSVLVPMLLKAVQELSAQNAALESRLAALEAK